MNQVRSTAAEDLGESKRLSQNLSTEIDKLSKKVAKYEVNFASQTLYIIYTRLHFLSSYETMKFLTKYFRLKILDLNVKIRFVAKWFNDTTSL